MARWERDSLQPVSLLPGQAIATWLLGLPNQTLRSLVAIAVVEDY